MASDQPLKNCSTCANAREGEPSCAVVGTLDDVREVGLAAWAVVALVLEGEHALTTTPVRCPEWAEVNDV